MTLKELKKENGSILFYIVELDKQTQPMCASLAEQLERFASYGSRFTHALEMVLEGDTDWIAKPMMESYHTVWFELHENFFSTFYLLY